MVPLVCFGFHGPPLTAPSRVSIREAALAAGSDHNASAIGECGWFNETQLFNVTNLEVSSGILYVGVFSDAKPTRTQSKMIPRGYVYSYGLGIEVFRCASEALGGPECNLRISSLPQSALLGSLHSMSALLYNDDEPFSPNQYGREPGAQLRSQSSLIRASKATSPSSVASFELSELGLQAGGTRDEGLTKGEMDIQSANVLQSGDPEWIPFSQQCVGLDQTQYFSLHIVDFVPELEVKYECISNKTQGISKCEDFEIKVKEDRIPLLHLRYAALPGKYSSDYVGEPSTGFITVSEPQRGVWYLAIFNPMVSTNQDKERKGLEGGEDGLCFMLSWRARSCGPGLFGNNCQWPGILYERVLKAQYESPFDSYYLPATKSALIDQQTEWVSLPALFNMSSWKFTQEQWGFAILKVADGASGGVLSFDVQTTLSVRTELYLRHEGCPADGNWDFRVNEDETLHLSKSQVETLGLGMNADGLKLLEKVTYRSLSLSVVYPMEGHWCLGLRYVPQLTTVQDTVLGDVQSQITSKPEEDWKQRWKHYLASYGDTLSLLTKALSNRGLSTKHEVSQPHIANLLLANDMQFRVTLHGCASDCSGHGNCQTEYEASRLHFFSYCHCDVKHGDIDCSALLLGGWNDLRQLVCLVFSNAAAILPSIWALRHKAFSEWITFALSGLASAIYHSCDAGGWCALSYSTLQFLDFWLSFLAIGMTCLYMAGFAGPTKAMLHIGCAVVTAALAKEDATSVWSVVVVVLMSSAGLLLGWGLETHKVSYLLFKLRSSPVQDNVSGLRLCKRLARSFYVQLRDRFHWPYLCLGLAFLLSALVGNKMELPQTYWIWHSWWHVSIYTSAFILLYSTKVEEGTTPRRDDFSGYRVVGEQESGITDSHESLVLELDSLPDSRDS